MATSGPVGAVGHHRSGQGLARFLPPPPGWRGPPLAVVLPTVAACGAYLVVAAPLLDLYAGRQTILEQRRMMALHLTATARELPALRARVAALRVAASKSRADFFAGDGDAIASPICKSGSKSCRPRLGPPSPAARTCPLSRAEPIAASASACDSMTNTTRSLSCLPRSQRRPRRSSQAICISTAR